jgi:hypothetical protein
VEGATLVRTTQTGVRPLGVRGEPLHQAHAQIRAAVRRRVGGAANAALGERAARLLAEPEAHDDRQTIDWYSSAEGPVTAWADMTPDQRTAAKADVDSLLGEIRTAGEQLQALPSEDARLTGRALALSVNYPGDEYIFTVGDQPVLVAWGYDRAAAGALLPPPFIAPAPVASAAAPAIVGTAGAVATTSRFAWLRWLLLGLLLIAMLLVASWLLRGCAPVDPSVAIDRKPPEVPEAPPPPPDDPTKAKQAALDLEKAKEAELKKKLEDLEAELKKKIDACPKTPPPTQAPPRKAELPTSAG